MKSQRSFSVRAGVYVLAVAVLAMGLTACGGGSSSTPPTTTQPPVAQTGLQVQNSGLSIWCTTRLYYVNLGTLVSANVPYTVCPAETGQVVTLPQGTYEYWFEYDAGGPRLFTTTLITTVNPGQVTFETVVIQ